MAKPFLSVIVPTQDDARRLPLTLIDLDRHLSTQEFSYEILCVDNGSRDGTSEMLRRFATLVRHCKVLHNPDRRGIGAVIREGLLAARGTWRLLHRADNAISIVEFNKTLPYLKENYEVLTGVRNKTRGALYARIAGAGVRDPFCFFKCFSSEAATHGASVTKMEDESVLLELMSAGKARGYKIREVPVFENNAKERGAPFAAPKLVWRAFKIRSRVRRGDYR